MSAPVIVLEFNELCPPLMDRFIREGRLPGFKALRDQSATYVTDAEEAPPNLEPWIQWVTIHTGLPFSQHKVFDLGDAPKLKAPRLWDLALEAGKKVWICGSMNAAIKAKPGRAFFMPDPWCSGVKPVPAGEFDTFYRLTSQYVQEHAREKAPWSRMDYIRFLFYMVSHGLSLRTLWAIVTQLARELRSKDFRWRRATLLDRLQWDLFRHIWKRERPDFSTFFLNSTAHFQHYHWREFEPHLFSSSVSQNHAKAEARDAIPAGYQMMDRIVQECLSMAPQATIVLMTALSQQPLLRYEAEGGKSIFKPVEHQALMKFAGADMAYEYAPVMAEEFHLYFENDENAEKALQALSSLELEGQPVMRARRQGREIFAGCGIYTPPAPRALVRSRAGNQSMPFDELFYPIEGVKSGGHHPDGIFWIHAPGTVYSQARNKMTLPQASRTLASLIGVTFNTASAPPQPVLRAAS